ncbi:MAG TPA: tripartite tricarboxylate transporter TctB family protein [Candidatus Binatia bacterium]|jgi:putative tricarboxylic transport membrane protein|nr:tripartite tricarboxylate transporter TctB family protein [Candidatus Binatia bacterium]
MQKTGVISAATLFGLALAALLEASKLQFGRLNSPQAGFFPLILAIFLAIFSLVLMAQAISEPKEESGASRGGSAIWKRIVLAVGALVVFGVLFESLGYITTTFLFIAFLLRAVEQQKWSLVVVVAFFTSLATYLVFGLLLNTPLPGGILGL